MLKRTLFFQNGGRLYLENQQLCFASKETGDKPRTVPIEDIGFIVIDTPALTITSALMQALAVNLTAVVFCDQKHLPASLFLPMTGNTVAQKTIQTQLIASDALKARLWKQTASAKIRNQAECLKRCGKGYVTRLQILADSVKSGDPENCEGTAARIYFRAHFPEKNFVRDPDGPMPNAALNYGYALLRAAVARALTGSGLFCAIGIHHHNQYNPYCLADDIMEPYRPFVDETVFHPENKDFFAGNDLNIEMKKVLLSILASDVMINGMKHPLMNALSWTTASLARCFLGEQKQIEFPEFPECPPVTTH